MPKTSAIKAASLRNIPSKRRTISLAICLAGTAYLVTIALVFGLGYRPNDVSGRGPWPMFTNGAWADPSCDQVPGYDPNDPLGPSTSCHEPVPNQVVYRYTFWQWFFQPGSAWSAPSDMYYVPVDSSLALAIAAGAGFVYVRARRSA